MTTERIYATTRNIWFLRDERGSLEPEVEIVLMTSEIRWEPDESGKLQHLEVLHTRRFSMSVEGLRAMATNFNDWAVDAVQQALEMNEKLAVTAAVAQENV